jgi:hypothetical protein
MSAINSMQILCSLRELPNLQRENTLRKYLVTSLLALFVSTPAKAELTLRDYIVSRNNSETRSVVDSFVYAFALGAFALHSKGVADGKERRLCLPHKLGLSQSVVFASLEQEVSRIDESALADVADTSLAIFVVLGLSRQFPCP